MWVLVLTGEGETAVIVRDGLLIPSTFAGFSQKHENVVTLHGFSYNLLHRSRINPLNCVVVKN